MKVYGDDTQLVNRVWNGFNISKMGDISIKDRPRSGQLKMLADLLDTD